MPEEWIFDWHKEPEGFVKWLYISLVTTGRIMDKAQFEALEAATDKSSKVKITVQVNGIEINPKHFFESVERNMDYNVAYEAQKIIDSKFEKLDDILQELEDEIGSMRGTFKRTLTSHMQKLGIDISVLEREY